MSSDIERAVHALALDGAAADVVRALAAANIAHLLLKGPAMAHWLYAEDPSSRTYTDVDLLVSPADFEAAEDVIAGMGFLRPVSGYRDRIESWVPESAWERPGAPPTFVDLHRGFHGVPVGAWDSFWTVMDEQTALIEVGGAHMRIPDAAGCALIAALHESAA
ncbi:MAG TPA: nucleotidyltransferase family protein, partial [Aeromicrobium sp.]|nr:nucleotidyltransferase family protein [Aeromicrobium sp.]